MNALSVEQQLEYMQELMHEMRARLQETRRQIEHAIVATIAALLLD